MDGKFLRMKRGIEDSNINIQPKHKSSVFNVKLNNNITLIVKKNLIYRESKKAWELEDNLGSLTYILERRQDSSIKSNMQKISLMLLEFYWILLSLVYS